MARFLVIGAGSIGKRHLANLLALKAGPVGICDPRQDRLKEADALHPDATFDNLDAAWAFKPDVALVANPTSLHLKASLEAAERGCHLFIEKPLSDATGPDLEALIAQVRRQSLIAFVACNMRFHPGVAAVKELIDRGTVGKILAARAEFGSYLPDWHPWEDYRSGYSASKRLGGGVLLDHVHEIDYLRWMLGEIESLSCAAVRTGTLDIETEDLASLTLRFASGAIGNIHLDYVQRAYRKTCQIIGAEGTILWDFSEPAVHYYRAQDGRWETVALPQPWEVNAMYLDELRHFLACLEGRERPAQTLEGAARILEIVETAKASNETGRTLRVPTAKQDVPLSATANNRPTVGSSQS